MHIALQGIKFKTFTMSSIMLNTLPANVPSMCIPRTFRNITRERVVNTIRDLNLGEIDHVDMLLRKNEKGEEFQRVFIHFKRWFTNPIADKARERLLTGKEIKVIYDEPWFWKISANRAVSRSKPPSSSSSSSSYQAVRNAPSIDFDDRLNERKMQRSGDSRKHSSYSERRSRPHTKTFVPRSPSSSPPRREEMTESSASAPDNLEILATNPPQPGMDEIDAFITGFDSLSAKEPEPEPEPESDPEQERNYHNISDPDEPESVPDAFPGYGIIPATKVVKRILKKPSLTIVN